MKKKISLLFFVFLLSTISHGQIVASDQYVNLGGNFHTINLLPNISLNGLSVTDSQVHFTLVSSDNNGFTLAGSNIYVQQGLNSGTWTLTYQVCEITNPTNCDTAVLTVNVCTLPFYLITTIIDSDCSFIGNIRIDNMPFGNWTLTVNGSYVVQGSGSSYTFYTQSYPQEYYWFEVADSNGCSSVTQSIGFSMPHIPLTIVPQTCALPADNLTLTDLPAGNWILNYRTSNTSNTSINGTGTSYTFTGLTAGIYCFQVFDQGCSSEEVCQYVGHLSSNMTGTMSAAAYVDYNNDGATNLGDIIQYTVGITNTTNCLLDTVTYKIEDAPNISGTLTGLAAGATTSVTVDYVLTQNDINNASVLKWVAVNGSGNGFNYLLNIGNPTPIPLAISDGIKLNAFFDTNNDGVQNIGEQDAVLGSFVYQLNNNGTNHTLYSQDGSNLIYESNPANIYDLSYNLYNNCDGQSNVSNISFNDIAVLTGSGITTYNFPITQAATCQDIQIYFGWSTGPRPGFNNSNLLYYRNSGTQTFASGTVTFTKDNAVSVTAVSEAGAITTPTGFTYNFSNMLPNETRTILVTMLTPTIPTVSLGQLVTNSASITIPDNDAYPNNNSCSLTRPVSGSFDPNDKTESHGGKILHSSFTADDYLTYMIRFENTGTAEAINIRVNDVLDAKLDETSIKMVKASHAYVLDRVGSNLNWRFDGVNLPPSIPGDEVTGHGYIVFQVKPKPGFVLGDIIPNTADIFFDFNPAIVTNTWTTEFVPFLGVIAFDASTFEYYPNPTSGIVTFHMKNTSTTINTIEVVDILGKTLLTKTVNYNDAFIDLTSFEKGMYLVKLKANGQEKTVKITKH